LKDWRGRALQPGTRDRPDDQKWPSSQGALEFSVGEAERMGSRASWRALTAVVGLGALAALAATSGMASDQRDGSAMAADPEADIESLFVFRSPDRTLTEPNTVFAMTLFPMASPLPTSQFDENVNYDFVIQAYDAHVCSGEARDYLIRCTGSAASPQTVTCTAPGGLTDTVRVNEREDGNGGIDSMRVFAGVVDNPAFMDFAAFEAAKNDPDTITRLRDAEGKDTFARWAAVIIVVEVANSAFGGATALSVYARTVRNEGGR
jgi:hypothetical protein